MERTAPRGPVAQRSAGPPMLSTRATFSGSLATLALGVCLGSQAESQTSGLSVRVKFGFESDCERPVFVRNFPTSAEFEGFLTPEGRVYGDLSMWPTLSPRIHFEMQPNGAPAPAPGGYISLKVLSNNHYRAIWDLPTDQFLVDIDRRGKFCTARLTIRLGPGMSEYSIFNGIMNYCSRIELKRISCETN
jgi:hypothetical protein